MRKTILYGLFLLINCYCLVNCQQSGRIPTTNDYINTSPKEAQPYLDSIKNLVETEKWYAAHTALIKFKSTFPQSNFQEEINTLNEKIRNAINIPSQKLEANNQGERLMGATFRKLRKDRNELKQRTFYHDPSATPYLNEDAVQAYIAVPFDKSHIPKLHFTVQNLSKINYKIQYVQFEIDGIVYPYLPKETFADNRENYYWQWLDDEVETAKDLRLLEILSQAKDADITFYFQQNYKKIRSITLEEKQGLVNVLRAYETINK